jgi:hypothetical protein
MEKNEFINKLGEELQIAVWKEEFEINFLNDELGKLEDDINKSSTIIYPSLKDGRKDQGRLQQEKSALQAIIKKREGILETIKTKLDFLQKSF